MTAMNLIKKIRKLNYIFYSVLYAILIDKFSPWTSSNHNDYLSIAHVTELFKNCDRYMLQLLPWNHHYCYTLKYKFLSTNNIDILFDNERL